MGTRWDRVKHLSDPAFRRLTGVKKATFAMRVQVVQEALLHKKGRRYQLSVEDQILLTLEYLRDYRTYFALGKSYGVSEATAWRVSRDTEALLVRSRAFALPGKKALLKSDREYEVILVDASETPVERPKKREP